MNDIEKTKWIETSTVHKVGTVLWAISAILLFFIFIKWCSMWSAFGVMSRTPSFTGVRSGLAFILPFFVLYTLLAAGMFCGINACTAIAKAYGILTLIMNILLLVASIILIKLVLAHFLHMDVVELIGGYLESAKSASAQVDADTLAQFTEISKVAAKKVAEIAKENPDAVNQIKETAKAAGKTLSDVEILKQLPMTGNAIIQEFSQDASEVWNKFISDPDVMITAQAGKKFFSSFIFIVLVNPLVQILTILCGFMLKMSDAKKTRVVSLVLCLFMGMFGGHLLYVKRTGSAVLRIILSLSIILAIIPLILAIVDIIKILSGKFNDNEKQPVTAWV